jgi:predicted DNA-binding transcriptional regulator YafY/transposase
MSETGDKRDRTARLLRTEIVLWQHPGGLSVQEIARKCHVSLRTAYRDLKALESELSVPIWENAGKRGITEGYFLPPITFSLTDAINIFLAARLMQSHLAVFSLSMALTFMKLNVILPAPVKQQLQEIIDYETAKPRNEKMLNSFNQLIQAWLTRRQAVIRYQELYGQAPVEHLIDPYFFEPGWAHTYYLIAYSHSQKRLRAYNIEQVVEVVSISPQIFEIPPSFEAMEFIKHSWGAMVEGEIITAKLLFKPEISPSILNCTFHVSQQTRIQADGSALITLTVRNTRDFLFFILGWGESVEVLEPAGLRDRITRISQSLAHMYQSRDVPGDHELNDAQWRLIQPVLPSSAARGRPRSDERNIINGILWVLRNGRKWADMPAKFGSRSTCHYWLQAWRKNGTWNRILETLFFYAEKNR